MFSQLTRMGKSKNAPEIWSHWKFKERPSQVFIDRVCDHIARTGQPESQEDLFQGRLDKSESFLRLKKISIDVKLRPEGDLAPCPRCHSPNKFKDGWLVYLPERGAAAVVGNECASGEAQDAADREWEAREQRRKDEDYLLAAVPQLHQCLAQIKLLLDVAGPAGELARRLRIDGKDYYARLRAARAQGGRLTVTQVLSGDSDGPRGLRTTSSSYDTAEHDVGTLRGLVLLSPSFAPDRDLKEIGETLKMFAQRDDTAAFDFVAHLKPSELNKTAATLKAAERRAVSVTKDLEDCRQFLSEGNIQVLNEWGQHPYADFRFTVGFLPAEPSGHRRFEFRGNPYFQHRVPPEFWGELSRVRLDAE